MGLLLIPIAVAVGGLCAYMILPRLRFLLLIFTLVATPFLASKSYERSFKLGVVPSALQVTSISYSEEKSWGFGPGGNEAGIRIFPLPDEVADDVCKRGIDFFNDLSSNSNTQYDQSGERYEEWHSTPISAGNRWKSSGVAGELDVYDYICAYGFCITIDDAVERQATEIINSKGSYYAYGRSGLIVVSPSKKLVLFMYNG